MSMSTVPDIAPLPDFLQVQEPVTLTSIRKSKETTMRGNGSKLLQSAPPSTELEVYFNQAMFDLSLRIDVVERYLKNEIGTETGQSEIMSQLAEMLRELKFCSDIGNFAISQLAQRN